MNNEEEFVIQALKKVKSAMTSLSSKSIDTRKAILLDIANGIEEKKVFILAENAKDADRMSDDDPKKDRLVLNAQRLNDLITSIQSVAELPDPTQQLLYTKIFDDGLKIQKQTVPLGIVGVIYESRPNVTIDIAALCIMSSNAMVLRGGSDAEFSNQALVQVIKEALSKHGVDENVVWLLPTDRKYVQPLLEAANYVDIIIPRGSQHLINFVREHSKIPTIETGAGVCHTYVDEFADIEKAVAIVVNAKVSRPSVCNALDTVLVHEKMAKYFFNLLSKKVIDYKLEVFAEPIAYQYLEEENYPYLKKAKDSNFGMEYLSIKCSIKVVDSFEQALEHISIYSSKHSEAIITEDKGHADIFLRQVDAAAVYLNASTRFTDGGAFGLGAEIGISTQKLHARGPFALEKLVTEKWVITGNGQIRE